MGVFDLIVGIMGVRVSNNPSKVKGFWVLCIVVVVLAVLNALTTLGAGSISMESVTSVACNLVLPILALVFATNIKKEQNL